QTLETRHDDSPWRLRRFYAVQPGATWPTRPIPPARHVAKAGATAREFRMTVEYRRILSDGYPILTTREGDSSVTRDGRSIGVDDAVHSPPCKPSKIVCVHSNYHSRVDEFITKSPAAPTYFHKPPTASNTHKGDVVRPERCKWSNYEGEIAIVIGRTCRNIAPSEAGDYIAGYSVANDYGSHDFRDTDAGSMSRVKGSDTLCPIVPGSVTGWDFHDKRLRPYVNGQLRQDDPTANMEWDMHYSVADIARTITSEPGDVSLSGTPANSRPVQPGDLVEACPAQPR
ncbi:hypothetical protein OY671_008274, partial [Metschnikowia pulcherrima]